MRRFLWMLVLLWASGNAWGAERAVDREVLVPAGVDAVSFTYHVGWGEGGEWDKAFDYFSRVWPNILVNLQKRFATGPIDWTDWLQRMRAATPQ